jgi:TPR repeat protein
MNVKELRKEAESGSVVAQAVLGLCYLYGRDTEVNYPEALRLLSLAKDKGASRAVVNLARMHAEGLGVPKDITTAIRFYEAVQEGEVRARLELARIYTRGIGGQPNPKKGLILYSAIAQLENGIDDSITAAFIGALTVDEIEEARIYVAENSEKSK